MLSIQMIWISNCKACTCRPIKETKVIRLFCYLIMLQFKMVPVKPRLNHIAIFGLVYFFKLW